MKFKLLLIFLSCKGGTILAQNWAGFDTLKSSRWEARVSAYAQLGSTNRSALSDPSNQQTLLSTFGFWVTASNSNGDKIFCGMDPYSGNNNFTPGARSSDTAQPYMSPSQWEGKYRVTSAEISKHISQFQKPDYQMPTAIAKWPGNGGGNFPALIAPFGDLDNDGLYEPANGDYPYVLGADHVFVAVTDSAEKWNIMPNAAGIQLTVQWYKPQGSAFDDRTLFFRLTVTNRSNQPLADVRVSQVADFALGGANDNYLGTLIQQNALYCYQGDAQDSVYGAQSPMAVLKWLNSKASASMYFRPDHADALRGRPSTVADFHQYARAKWRTGEQLNFGGEGTDGSDYCSFIYSQGTDSAYKSQNWSEEDAVNEPGRRTALISSESFALAPNQSKVFDGSIVVLPQTIDATALSKVLDTLQKRYDLTHYTLQLKPNPKQPNICVFPNPVSAGTAVRIKQTEAFAPTHWRLTNALGQVMASGMFETGETQFSVPEAKGLYTLELMSREWRLAKPLLVY